MFKLDILKTVTRLTPPFLRNSFMLAWLDTLLHPLRAVNAQLTAYVEQKRKELTYNGQTIHMERMLNDLFDPELRQIKIEHSLDEREFDYFNAEGQNPDYDYFRSETHTITYDYFMSERVIEFVDGFRVRIPLRLTDREDQIRGRVLQYKLAGVQYSTLLA